jgi:hypothetical protein
MPEPAPPPPTYERAVLLLLVEYDPLPVSRGVRGGSGFFSLGLFDDAAFFAGVFFFVAIKPLFA